MKSLIVIALLVSSFLANAKSYLCTVEFTNSLDTDATIMYRSYYPQLSEPLGKIKKLVLSANQSEVVNFQNIPFVKWDLLAPKSKAKVIKGVTPTSCRQGGKVLIERGT